MNGDDSKIRQNPFCAQEEEPKAPLYVPSTAAPPPARSLYGSIPAPVPQLAQSTAALRACVELLTQLPPAEQERVVRTLCSWFLTGGKQ